MIGQSEQKTKRLLIVFSCIQVLAILLLVFLPIQIAAQSGGGSGSHQCYSPCGFNTCSLSSDFCTEVSCGTTTDCFCKCSCLDGLEIEVQIHCRN